MRSVLAGQRRLRSQWVGGWAVVLLACALANAPAAANEPAGSDLGAIPAAATTGPSGGFIPAQSGEPSQTSNGADLQPQPQVINIEQPIRSPLEFSATAAYMYGSVGGSLQMSKNGKVGTSNADRPHLDNVGVSTANIFDGEIAAKWNPWGEFFAGTQIISLSGSAYLGGKTLTTDGVTFPARARVASDITLDWYRLGYRYAIPLDVAQNGVPDLTFTPWLAAISLDFSYHLTAPHAAVASRNLFEPGVQIGATFAWRPNGGPLSLEASIGGFPTIPDLPTISVESLYARYHFYQYDRFNFTGLLGVAWEQQQFRDDQALPNHISANFGPMLMAGLQVRF